MGSSLGPPDLLFGVQAAMVEWRGRGWELVGDIPCVDDEGSPPGEAIGPGCKAQASSAALPAEQVAQSR